MGAPVRETANNEYSNNQFKIHVASTNYNPLYNIPPTSEAVIVYLSHENAFEVEPSRFGVLPFFAKPKDPEPVSKGTKEGLPYSKEVQQHQSKLFNCRKETIAQDKSVWTAFRDSHRCVVPIQGYFEWKTTRNDKQPYYVHAKDRPLLFLAGLYSHNTNYNGTDLVSGAFFSSFAIMTGPGKGKDKNDFSWLHSRKPIVLEPGTQDWNLWLDNRKKWDEVAEALNVETNPGYSCIASHRVAKSVGNPGNKGAEIIKEEKITQPSISLFFGKRKSDEEEGKKRVKVERKDEDTTGTKCKTEPNAETTESKAEMTQANAEANAGEHRRPSQPRRSRDDKDAHDEP